MFKKTKKIKQIEQKAYSAELNPQIMNIIDEPISSTEEVAGIIKTTDSIKFLNSEENRKSMPSNELASIVNNSFELVRRKITSEYERIIVSGNYVDNAFIAIQVALKNYEKKWAPQMVEAVCKKFTDFIPELVGIGKTVFISKELIIEPVLYIDKIFPAWKATPEFALLTNAIKWEEMVEILVERGELTNDSIEIVREIISAFEINLGNGYHLKLSRFIVMQLEPSSSVRVALLSNDTVVKLNEIYIRYLKTGEQKQINKYDAMLHYEKTQAQLEREIKEAELASIIEMPFEARDDFEEIGQHEKSGAFLTDIEEMKANPDGKKEVEGETLEQTNNVSDSDKDIEIAAAALSSAQQKINANSTPNLAPQNLSRKELKERAKAEKAREKEINKAKSKENKNATILDSNEILARKDVAAAGETTSERVSSSVIQDIIEEENK